MKKINLLVIAAPVFLAGCAFSIGSPKVTQIDQEIFEVRIDVFNGSHGSPKFMDMTLAEAAKKSKSIGCNYFVAIDNKSQKFILPQAHVTENLSRLNDGKVAYTSSSGQSYYVTRPQSTKNTFACFKDKPTAVLPGLVFNADLILKNAE